MAAETQVRMLELRPDGLVPVALLLVLMTLRYGAAVGVLTSCLFLGSLVAHEAGHILAAAFTYTPVTAYGFCMKGAYIKRRRGAGAKELLISAAGPFVNLALANIFWHTGPLGSWVAQINLILAAVNLFPFAGSDGRRILACLRELLISPVTQRNDKLLV